MEIPQWMVAYMEEKSWDDDIRQDMYVRLLEMDDKQINKTYLCLMYSSLVANKASVDNRRAEIVQDNVNAIRSALGMDAEAADPMDVLELEEELSSALVGLSPVLFETLERAIINGESPEDLAEEEGVEPNTIYQRVWKVKQQLRGTTND